MSIEKFRVKSLLASLCLLLIALAGPLAGPATMAGPATGQNETSYQDPEGKFELQLPTNWKAVNYKDGAGNDRVDIIYRDRSYGLLKITQESVPGTTELKTYIQSEIDQNLRFRPGYVYNNIERFVGPYAQGELLQFDFSHGGAPKKARNYYLRNNPSTLWVLRFTGNRDVLSPLRHETDAIARSFKPLK